MLGDSTDRSSLGVGVGVGSHASEELTFKQVLSDKKKKSVTRNCRDNRYKGHRDKGVIWPGHNTQ